jgi:hypothetical protein
MIEAPRAIPARGASLLAGPGSGLYRGLRNPSDHYWTQVDACPELIVGNEKEIGENTRKPNRE